MKSEGIFMKSFNKKIIFIILSLFFHEGLSQMPSEDQASGNSTVETNGIVSSELATEDPANENIFLNFIKTSRLNGKTGIGAVLYYLSNSLW